MQVVSSILNNAARYTPEGGRIVVSLAREGEHAVLAVRDNGIGIEPRQLDSVFDLFVQGHDRARARRGAWARPIAGEEAGRAAAAASPR